MRRSLLITFGILVLVWVAWPFVSIFAFGRALEERDPGGIDAGVDWPALRASLAEELSAGLSRGQQQNAVLGALGRPLIDAALQAYLTPAGLVALLSGVRPATGGAAPAPARAPAQGGAAGGGAAGGGEASGPRFGLGNVRWAFFTGPTTFRLDLATSEKSPVVTTIWTFSGTWRLSRIVLPPPAARR